MELNELIRKFLPDCEERLLSWKWDEEESEKNRLPRSPAKLNRPTLCGTKTVVCL